MTHLAETIRKARLDHNLTQEQLAQMIGVKSGSVIYNWESSTARPDVDKIPKICEALQITPDMLFRAEGDYPSVAEMNMIRKYRTLDGYGKAVVDSVLALEHERTMETQPKKQRARLLRIDFYNDPASAGTGGFLDNEAPEQILVKESPEAETADYVIPVRGNSMEPTFYDGSKVFVEKTETVYMGEVGIFVVNGEVFIKELGDNCLISHNKEYRPRKIGANDSVYCCGRVIGIVDET